MGRRLAWIVILLGGCGAPPLDPPSAVITSDPESVCLGDGFRTQVTLDASDSAPRLMLVPVPAEPGTTPLTYEWTLSGSEHRIVAGDLTTVRLTVTMAGDRPLHAALEVTDEVGAQAAAFHSVGVTVIDPDLPDVTCRSDDECGPCRVCDPGPSRCVRLGDLE